MREDNFKRGTEVSRLATFGSITAFSLYVKAYLTEYKSGNILCSMVLLSPVDIVRICEERDSYCECASMNSGIMSRTFGYHDQVKGNDSVSEVRGRVKV